MASSMEIEARIRHVRGREALLKANWIMMMARIDHMSQLKILIKVFSNQSTEQSYI